MAFSFTPSNHFKYMQQRGAFNLKAQTHNISLTFGKCDTGVTSLGVVAGKFNRAAGSFLTDGFCVGQEILTAAFTNAANNGRFVITAVTATDITVAETLVNEAAGGNEQITSTRDDTISRGADSFITDGFSVGDIIYTNSANSGNVGPFVVRGVIALKMVVMPADGTLPAMTAGTEANLTVGTHIIKCLLMRDGFTFSQDNHATRLNIKGTTGATTLSVVATTGKITRASGSFVTDGYVPGNSITTANFANAGNNSTFIISTVSALEIVVTDNTGMVDETGSGDETIVAEDELATGSGYTKDTKLTGVPTHTEDDTNNRGNAVFPTITWTPSAAATIGPTPGLLLYLDSSSDNTIIGYFDFGGNESATDPTPFTITGLTMREL